MKQELNERRPRRRRRTVLIVLLLIVVAPFAIPENARIPAPRGRPVIASVPRPWKATTQTQGWKKMFFVDPGALIGSSRASMRFAAFGLLPITG